MSLKNLLKILLFLFFFLALSNAQNYSYLKFDHLSIEDGLSANTVYGIRQDSHGFLWICTNDGLNRYDGVDFKVFRNDPEDTNSISHNKVRSIYEDSLGYFWIATANGLNCFDPVLETFKRFNHDPNNLKSLPDNNIREICSDKKGSLYIRLTKTLCKMKISGKNAEIEQLNFNLKNTKTRSMCFDGDENVWIGTKNEGLIKYNIKKNTINKINIQFLNDDSIEDIEQDYLNGNKILWIGGSSGKIYKYDIDKNRISQYLSDSIHFVVSISKDPKKNNILWAATWGSGLIRLNTSTGKFQSYKHIPNDIRSLSHNRINTLYFDNAGLLWAGNANSGLDIFDEKKMMFSLNVPELKRLSEKSINCIFEDFNDTDSIIWIGTSGGGVNTFNINKNKMDYYSTIPGNANSLANDLVWNIYKDKQNILYICTFRGLSYCNMGKKQSNELNFTSILKAENISSVFQDSRDNIWIGSYGKGLYKYKHSGDSLKQVSFIGYNQNNPAGLSDNSIGRAYEDMQGNIWIGTYNGLNKMDPETQRITRYFNDSNNPLSLSNNIAIYVFERPEDCDSILWIATSGGLNKFNKNNETFHAFTEKDGLANNVVMGVLGDENGNLWMSTNKGISKFYPEIERFKNFDVNGGLQSNEYNGRAYHHGKSGIMYFGGINGFNAFYPDSIKENTKIPNVVLSKFTLFNKEVELDSSINYKKEIVLNYDENFFAFNFAALDFTNTEKNQYAYMLEGVDPEWVEIGNINTASYTKVSPGNYVFRVKGSNNDGYWNETGKFIKIKIVPPFWQTAWFKGLIVFSLIAALYIAFRARIKAIEGQKRKLEGLVKIRTNELFEKNQQIMSSIRYAEKIQQAIMPVNEHLKKLLPEHFIFFRAKDVVSGDFYWLYETGGQIFLAAIDCTGHGVPGAFMAMIGNTLLNQIVKEHGVYEPNKILENLHAGVRHALKQDEEGSDSRDGMDVCLVRLESANNTLTFAGAKRPLYLVKKTKEDYFELIEIKGDRKSIGGKQKEEVRTFTNKHVNLSSGDMVYLTTDGFIDQNNSDGKKFGSKKLKILITSLAELSCSIQKEKAMSAFNNHMQNEEQRDDVTIIGFRV